MTAAQGLERGQPQTHVGDYPAWRHLLNRRGSTEDEEIDHEVGFVIRFMWDYGVTVPLWDAAGLLPEEPERLRAVLGLSGPLIHELSRWGNEMNHLDAAGNRLSREGLEPAYGELDSRARDLVSRLQDELGDRYTVRYVPW